MKTAEEWAVELHSMGCELPYPYMAYNSLSDHIKQIQLDAYKAGMTESAVISATYSDDLDTAIMPLSNSGDYEAQWYVRARNDAKNSILHARDNKTEI